MLGQIMLGQIMMGQIMLGQIMLGQIMMAGLTDAQKDAIAKASATAEASALAATKVSSAAAPGQLREKGMKVHIMTPAEVDAIKALTLPAFKEAFMEAAGDDATKIIDMLEKL